MIDYGGCAFPINGGYQDSQDNGMTLRDYFAARAQQPFGSRGRSVSHHQPRNV